MKRKESQQVISKTTSIEDQEKRQCNVLPARYVMAILGCFGVLILHTLKANLSVALVAMVDTHRIEIHPHTNIACVNLLHLHPNQSLEIGHKGEFSWDANTQSHVLGAFFYGYVVTQIPGGVIANSYGAKWLFGLGILIASIFTLLTSVAARMGTTYLITVRIIKGLAGGVTVPAINTMIGLWVPKNERSRIATLVYVGSPIGTVVAMAMSGYIAESKFLGGWPSIFYVFGSAGCVWFLFWSFLVYETPEDHPGISQSELQYIHDQNPCKKRAKVPWLSILTSFRVWALAIAHFGQNWGFYTLLTEMPTYISNILHFPITENGSLSSLPYILQALFAGVASVIADKMRQSNIFTITVIRKILNSIAFYGPSVCILLVTCVGCQTVVIIVLLCVAMGLNGFAYSGYNITHVDMSPEFAGTLMGITNCVSNLSGVFAPMTVGKIIQSGQTVRNWGLVFGITSTVYFISGSVYNLFCSADSQPWDVSESDHPSRSLSSDDFQKKKSSLFTMLTRKK